MVELIGRKVPVKVVFVNGPPGSGKDTVGDILCAHGSGRRLVQKFAHEVKERTHAAFRIVDERGRPVAHDYFEKQKEVPLECFLGLSPRQAYIEFSERFYKQLFGQDVFGRLLAKRLELTLLAASKKKGFAHVPDAFTITDSGFEAEAVPIVEMFDAENCTLIRVHRKGHDFLGDSRSYIDLSSLGVKAVDVDNPGDTIASFQLALERAAPLLFLEIT